MSKPIHQRIFEDIEARIMDGRWQPGQRIPYEYELEEEYGCSRMTVNKALSALAGRGMIVRKRRAGSFVAQPQIDRTVMQIQDIGAAAELAGHDYSYEITSSRVDRLDADEAAQVGVADEAEVRRVTCLHFVDGEPHALEKRLIMLDAVPAARSETFATKSPGSWLLEQVPWSAAKHVIKAVPADAASARALQMQKGAPCLLLTRQTWQGGRMVTSVEITHPGDRYQFTGYFQPNDPTS
ncbi:histidine utilization repressor [Acuticoccus mangrovi]|uniref:Histidine utilization repressor n=1 Tax=Acuticoccus mangrovi TaxID=2796142 RepID=A0A934IQH8_9HYPH|nr:histidine utilization repressor [Acuticoccus mangrovi]MBJ3776437.1 histidine utilization repressor [Acuticoccus mangrovi]